MLAGEFCFDVYFIDKKMCRKNVLLGFGTFSYIFSLWKRYLRGFYLNPIISEFPIFLFFFESVFFFLPALLVIVSIFKSVTHYKITNVRCRNCGKALLEIIFTKLSYETWWMCSYEKLFTIINHHFKKGIFLFTIPTKFVYITFSKLALPYFLSPMPC